jgi:hypothetical protein
MGMGSYNPTIWRVNANPMGNAGALANILNQQTQTFGRLQDKASGYMNQQKQAALAELMGTSEFSALSPEQKMLQAAKFMGGQDIGGSNKDALGMLLGGVTGTNGSSTRSGGSGRSGGSPNAMGGQLDDINKIKAFNAYMDLLSNPNTPMADKIKLIQEMKINKLWNRQLGFAVKDLLGPGAMQQQTTGKSSPTRSSSSRSKYPQGLYPTGVTREEEGAWKWAYDNNIVRILPYKDGKTTKYKRVRADTNEPLTTAQLRTLRKLKGE